MYRLLKKRLFPYRDPNRFATHLWMREVILTGRPVR